ncbi:transcriptional regulator GutM [Propionispora vibrioides]|uniref:Glucitol operon activator protein (GutM) n=1 Tax=Propionispora vibrioides TaxID=112903 RepID=A0A1H8T6L0_9FIRM|nr:transcriptional regulator GutM [Propionispora vibrioides]SEO86254.1 Glucitol operon activator protein (GutM) [Propionispora vibrioides]
MWKFIILIALLWSIQGILGYWQMKHFNARFKRLREEGRVVIGRSYGRLKAGVVVLICIDPLGNIMKAERMAGRSSFARFKPFNYLNNHSLHNLTEENYEKMDMQTKKAILNAVDNFLMFNNQKVVSAVEE